MVLLVLTGCGAGAQQSSRVRAAATVMGPCRPDQLHAAVVGQDSVMSQPFVDIRLVNRGSARCRLDGYPGIRVLSSTPTSYPLHGVHVKHGAFVRGGEPPRAVVLARGAAAYLTVETAVAYQGGLHIFTLTDVAITLPGSPGALRLRLHLDASRAPHGATEIAVSPFRALWR